MQPPYPPILGNRRYIYVSFHGGKAFLDTTATVQNDDEMGISLSLHLSFNGQRFRGQKVAMSADPAFSEGFLFELPERLTVSLGSVLPDPCLAYSEPVHIAIMRHVPAGDMELIGCHALDWRHLVLRALEGSPTSFQAVEVNGVGASFSLPAGVVNMRVDVLPPPPPGLDVAVARAQLALERARVVDNERIFLVYAKQWWREVSDIHCPLRRYVRLFAKVLMALVEWFTYIYIYSLSVLKLTFPFRWVMYSLFSSLPLATLSIINYPLPVCGAATKPPTEAGEDICSR